MRRLIENIFFSFGINLILIAILSQKPIYSQTKVLFYSDSKYYPYEFLDFDGKPAGFNVDLLKKIAELNDFDLEITLGNWSELYEGMLEKSDSQVIITDLYYSKQREETFDFSEPIDIAYDRIYTRKESKITALKNLRNKKVAVQEKSALSRFLIENFTGIEQVYTQSEYDALVFLSEHKSDAAIVNEKVGEYILEHFDFSDIEATSYPISPKEYAFAVKKGNKEMVDKISDGMKQLKESGYYSRIYTKWFGRMDIKGIPLKDALLYGGLALLVIALTVTLILFQNRSLRRSVKDISTIHQKTSSELKYQATFNSYMIAGAPIGIVVVDVQNRIIEVNEYFEGLFGYSKKETLGNDLSNLIIPSHSRLDMAKTLQEFDRRNYIRKETRRRHKDGTMIDVELLTFPLIIDNERKGLFCFYIDIRERKRLEREIIKSKNIAEKLSEFKSEFLAQMSHEIRTPLNVIIGYLAILEGGSDVDIETKEVIDAMKDASSRIIRTIELMLNYSEVRNGIYEPEPRRLHLWKDVIEKILKEVKPAAEEKHISIIADNRAEHDDLYIDQHSASKIFEQIIDNAVKYTNEGFIKIIVDEKDDMIISEISDTGIGITKEYLPRIFEPFSQEQQGYTRSYDGNGLGLALVKKYCEINNAMIKVESSKGAGTSFKVIFRKNSVNRILKF